MPRIVGLGEAMGELLDLPAGQIALSFAGDVFNTLAYVGMLGADAWHTEFVSAIGRDVLSRRFETFANGLDVSLRVYRDPDSPIGLYMISTDADGERRFSYWRANSPARRFVDTLQADQRLALDLADIVYVSGITLAVLHEAQRSALELLCLKARGRGARIAFDPNYRPALWNSVEAAQHWVRRFYRISSIVFPGLEDEAALFSEATPLSILNRPEFSGADAVIIKAGKGGAMCRIGEAVHSSPFVVPPEVIDTTSAGDGFNAAWLVGAHAGLAPATCLRFASETASAICAHPGAIVPRTALPRLSDLEDPS
ncbi:sugar kinase [Hyphomonas johnsonii]|uniref:PfkB protein n=1 Tax=Hyphomonas johnsonii MHS-2 TaxID=1280950 RepID=A0A059FSC6_9PROT|nr:sugar kinase [Hyphomonas johnsonii]KCZ93378.1 PfkB protein [Hyphomonas johnsonii MHS-2]